MPTEPICLSHAAELLGVRRQTISDVAQCWNVEFKPVPRLKGGKGLDPMGLATVCLHLNKPIPAMRPIAVPA